MLICWHVNIAIITIIALYYCILVIQLVGMYIATIPNRDSPPAILLREGYREDGKVKTRTLANLSKLPAEAIAAHGAVSVQVARAMATGARERLGATFAVSVTGIAGPDGGSAAKPVGLTYIAVAGPVGVEVRRFGWSGDRLANKRDSARAALELLIAAAEAAGSEAAAGSEGAAPGPSPAGAR